MAKYFRRVIRRKLGKNKAGKKVYQRRMVRYGKTKSGLISIIRKTSAIVTNSTPGTVGSVNKTDPTGTCLNLGTPVYVPGTVNCYDIPFSMVFRLDQLMNSSDITSLADQYKIVSAIVKLHANFNLAGTGPQTGAIPFLEYIQDHDDGTTPTLALLREKMGTKTKYFSASKPFIQMGVRPRIADTVYNNGTTPTAYAIPKPQWLNTTSPGVEHYGLKGVLHNVLLPGGADVASCFNWDVSLKVLAKDFQ